MYVLLDDRGNVLIEETDFATGHRIERFIEPEKIKAINTYRNKDARIKTFFPMVLIQERLSFGKKE